jgi:hypothetical protein
VRAVASRKLKTLAARTGAPGNEADLAHYSLIAADVKRFLERPGDVTRLNITTPAPPGAPIGGDVPQNWLESPVWCVWDDDGQY